MSEKMKKYWKDQDGAAYFVLLGMTGWVVRRVMKLGYGFHYLTVTVGRRRKAEAVQDLKVLIRRLKLTAAAGD